MPAAADGCGKACLPELGMRTGSKAKAWHALLWWGVLGSEGLLMRALRFGGAGSLGPWYACWAELCSPSLFAACAATLMACRRWLWQQIWQGHEKRAWLAEGALQLPAAGCRTMRFYLTATTANSDACNTLIASLPCQQLRRLLVVARRRQRGGSQQRACPALPAASLGPPEPLP